MSDHDHAQEDVDAAVQAGLAGAAEDAVFRYGAAVREHAVAYEGVDRETGKVLKRGLKGIAESRVGAEAAKQNLKQQAGFAAEVKEVARRRAEEALAGKTPTTMRTDDIPGHVNDQLFDITSEIDAHGNPVSGSSVQMKFIGSSPQAAVKEMLGSGAYQKYFDNDCKMMVPRDYFDGMVRELDGQEAALEEQIRHLEAGGRADSAAKKEVQLRKCRQLRRNLRQSKVSNAEAMEARLSPRLSTAKDIMGLAHGAGVEQAKMGAAVGGGVSIVRNAVDLFNGRKDLGKAALDVAKDTAGAAAVSYATGAAGAAVKGLAGNSASGVVRNIAKTNLPAYIATATLDAGKTLLRYFKGDIDGGQCLEELGEKGFDMVGSAMYAAIGQTLIPIPVVGAMAGSMVGYMLSSAAYRTLTSSLREAKLARERRILVERECAEAVHMLRAYRQELEANINRYLGEKRHLFDSVFESVRKSLELDDVDGYISAMNRVTQSNGEVPLFADMDEFDALMRSGNKIEI